VTVGVLAPAGPPQGAAAALAPSRSSAAQVLGGLGLGAFPPESRAAAPCGVDEPGAGATARVVGTGPSGLRVRAGPSRAFPTEVILREGARVTIRCGPRRDVADGDWVEVEAEGAPSVVGWSNAAFLDQEPAGAAAAAGEPSPILGWVYSVEVTAYSFQPPGEGAQGSITRSGVPARWGLVAVDPGLIPLGSQLLIDGFSHSFIAADTGDGVVGAHVDVFIPSAGAAVAFGVQYRDVIVLS